MPSDHSKSNKVVVENEKQVFFVGLDGLHAAQLVLGVLVGDPVDGESALDVVDQVEVLVGPLDPDDVLEARGELGVGAYLAVDLDLTLLQDPLVLDGGFKFHESR